MGFDGTSANLRDRRSLGPASGRVKKPADSRDVGPVSRNGGKTDLNHATTALKVAARLLHLPAGSTRKTGVFR